MPNSVDISENIAPTPSKTHREKGGYCMLGKIEENRTGKGAKYIVRFQKVFKRFNNLEQAERFLNALRYKYDEGQFDERDYMKDEPLSFLTLTSQWLKMKESKVRCIRNLNRHIKYATDYFKNANIRDIDYPELEDFFEQLPTHLSDKSRHNIKATLHSFWSWVIKRNRKAKVKILMPEFPDIHFESAYQPIIDKPTQQAVLEELKRITPFNRKIHICALWLSTYVNVRPIEMIHIREGDIDLTNGIMYITHNKERKPKKTYLLDEDIEMVKSFPTPIDKTMFFFRHEKRKGVHKAKRGRFGKDYVYSWWRKACKNLNIDCPLYSGTKHSTVVALGEDYTPEQIRRYGTGHTSNKSFDRYLQVEGEQKRGLFASARCTTGAQRKIVNLKS
jgi:integrase